MEMCFGDKIGMIWQTRRRRVMQRDGSMVVVMTTLYNVVLTMVTVGFLLQAKMDYVRCIVMGENGKLLMRRSMGLQKKKKSRVYNTCSLSYPSPCTPRDFHLGIGLRYLGFYSIITE